MNHNIKTIADLGRVVRAVRKSQGMRLDDTAACCGVSKQFLSDLEHGKETIQMGKVLRVLDEIGISLTVNSLPTT